MTRYLSAMPLVVWLAACSADTQGGYYSPEDAAADRHAGYTDPDFDPPAERDFPSCPESFPTGGPIDGEEEAVGPFFCEY